jgi:cytochrome d ubiquinol oxidase subunit II
MHTDPNFLQALWFILIAVLWAGYFVLEGFDFGVGMLVKILGRDDVEKRMIIHTIGPVWDGNEVWLLTAGGATFAAFPSWYATAFSGFYLALFLILAALIVRGVSFEFWGKVPSARWRSTWEWAMAIASGAAALLFGVAWANFVKGVPMGANGIVHASLLDLLHPYALLGGVMTLSVFLTHGALFLSLRTKGELHDRAQATVTKVFPVALLAAAAFLIWTLADQSFDVGVLIPVVLAAGLLASVPVALRTKGDGLAFGLSAGAIIMVVIALAGSLYPNAVPSTTSHAFDLTLAAASSSHYTLVVMTVVAVIFVPIVLGYTGWTYFVFRHRIGRDDYEGPMTPVAVLEHRNRARGGDVSGGAPAAQDVGPSVAGAPPHGV